MKYFIAIALLQLAVVYGHGMDKPSCPPFWTGHGKYCWRYFSQPLTFADAEATCAQFAPCDGFEIGSLAVVSNRNIERFMETVLGNLAAQPPASDVWIGLQDLVQEGTFKWSNGDALGYSNFAFGQPDNGVSAGVPSQNCVMYSPALNAWDDVQCELTLPFFCMMPYEVPQRPPMGPHIPGGPGGPRGNNPNLV